MARILTNRLSIHNICRLLFATGFSLLAFFSSSPHITKATQARQNNALSATVTVPSTVQWVYTGINVNAGDSLTINASGAWIPGPPETSMIGPDGSSIPSADNFFNLTDIGCLYPSCAATLMPHWAALIGYIGNNPPQAGSYINISTLSDALRVFLVGSNYSASQSQSGPLWLAFNDDAYSGNTSDNAGQVTAQVTDNASSAMPVYALGPSLAQSQGACTVGPCAQPASLYEIDPSMTGADIPLGGISGANITMIAESPIGTLWGSDGSNLYEIVNPGQSWQASSLGNLNLGSDALTALTFSPDFNRLYGTTTMGKLVEIDPGSAQVQVLSSFLTTSSGQQMSFERGLATGPDGSLYALAVPSCSQPCQTQDDELVQIVNHADTTWSLQILSPDLGTFNGQGLFFSNGGLYEVNLPQAISNGCGSYPNIGDLFQIDLSNGTSQHIRCTTFGILAATAAPAIGTNNITLAYDYKQVPCAGVGCGTWPTDDIGGSSSVCTITMHESGCAITAAADVLAYYNVQTPGTGELVNPGNLNAWLGPNGYVAGCELNFDALGGGKGYGKITSYPVINTLHMSLSLDQKIQLINRALALGEPVILSVPSAYWDGAPHTQPGLHFIVLTGNAGTATNPDYTIADPYYYDGGQTIPWSKSLYGTLYGSLAHIDSTPGWSNSYFQVDIIDKSGQLQPPPAQPAWNLQASSTVQLLVTDPNGVQTGFDPSSGTILQNISSSIYAVLPGLEDLASGASTLPGSVYFSQENPLPGSYTVQVVGASSGTYALSLSSTDASGNLTTQQVTGSTILGQVDTYLVTNPSAPGQSIGIQTPTNTPVPPTDTPILFTDTPLPTKPPAPPTNTPLPPPTTSTSAPMPPTNTPMPPSGTPTVPAAALTPPTGTPVPPTATPTSPPCPPGSKVPLAVGKHPRGVHGGNVLDLAIRTAPKATVLTRLQVTTTKLVTTGKGKHRKHVRRTVVLYQATQHGAADAHGRLMDRLRVAYKPGKDIGAGLIVTAQTGCGTAVYTDRVMIEPARVLPLSLSALPGGVVSGHILHLRLQALAHAQISATLQVTTTKVIVTGKGKHRRRTVHTVVLYAVTRKGAADARGHATLSLPVRYRPPKPAVGTLIVTERADGATATRTIPLTIRP